MAAIMIGMPVYNGQEFVVETLLSIKNQTFRDYEVIISIDGNDEQSRSACEAFTRDPRFRIVLQPERLGWAGNLNWLMTKCEADFFCYWQQDDLTDPNYLETLCAAGLKNPEAVCFYSDVKWFGARQVKDKCESIRGTSIERALAAMRGAVWVPFRGLIRRSALERVGSLRTNHEMSSLEDLVWMVKLAREGELHRVKGTQYYKRAHDKAVHLNWHKWPEPKQRAAWINHGLGLLEAVLQADADQLPKVEAVLDRLISKKYWRLYQVKDPGPFAADIVEAAVIYKSSLIPDLVRLFNDSDRAGTLGDFPYCQSALHLWQERNGSGVSA